MSSNDHTSKLLPTWGYVRPDGRLVSQYKSVLIVLNNKGNIIVWQLTKTTSLDEVTLMLTAESETLREAGSGRAQCSTRGGAGVRIKVAPEGAWCEDHQCTQRWHGHGDICCTGLL